MAIKIYKGDLPAGLDLGPEIAVDTETLGLNPLRDKLCVVQLSSGDGNAHLVQVDRATYDAPRLKALFENRAVLKIFHFARFDVAALKHYLGVETGPLYCTKIASKLTRTYTDRHGLKDLVKELLGIELNKQQQSSDWGAHVLSDSQKQYAAQDVLYLHELKSKGRKGLARSCFDFVPVRAELDLLGWTEDDVFAH
ncbi:MAG: ribonuclease D [Alphaproteobacteria bacterium]|nr:MAG: ribonuclease D [Alphaproteobacteria bacterium]